MKRFALRFALIMTVFYFLNLLTYRQNVSILGAIVSSLVAGIVTFFLMQLLLPKQGSLDDIISDVTNKHADLIAYAPVNYVKKWFINSTVGVGCLYKDKLVFIPHRMNLSRKEYTLFFYEIESVSNYRACGIFDIGLKIGLKSGITERFIIDKKSSFYNNLFGIIHTV